MHKTSPPEITPIEGEVLQKEREWKYEPWMCQAIIDAAKQGKRIAGMCNVIGIKSKDTFHRWKREIPEFKAAYEEANLYSQELFEDIIVAGGTGKIKNFNFNAIAMLMNNCFKEDYSRSATGSNTEINIGEINNSMSLTDEELKRKLLNVGKKLHFITQDDNEGSRDSQEGIS